MSKRGLSEEEKAEARRIFAADGESSRVCMFCGGFHHRACPRVAEFELYEGTAVNPGGLKRVRFWGDWEWNDDCVVWPEMVGDDDDDDDDDEEAGADE